MTDVFSAKKRRAIMQSIRGKDTKPEMIVRRIIHRLGYRYRLHDRSLPGTPDLVFSSRRKIILVHGCFWHRHNCRKGRSMPGTHVVFWRTKLLANKKRDLKRRKQLRRLGWQISIAWECRTSAKNIDRLIERLVKFLDG